MGVGQIAAMTVAQLAEFIYYLKATHQHRTVLVHAPRGDGKSQTNFALVERLREFGLTACFAQTPAQVRIADFLSIDDAGPLLYKRDFGKTENKEKAKALQRVRGAIPMLMLNVVDIERLDIDVRESFGTHGRVITHGWMEIQGRMLGPIIPTALPPDDTEDRQQTFLEAFKSG